jgi:hypothetical protein
MDKTPTRNMGPSRTLRLRYTPLSHPNPGKVGFKSPSGTHANRQGWDARPRNARHFRNVEKKQHGVDCTCIIVT